jgi:MerR family transcriptional regulator, light-induced transcriptional regulator
MPEQALTASEAAHLIGVAVTTLRTWDRRYGLGPQDHQTGRHRRYDPDDVERLAEMRRLTASGVPPAQAAAWILHRSVPSARRDGGGNAIAVGAANPAVRGLTRAAMRLDVVELRRILTTAIREQGVVAAWTELLAPALIHIGRKHATTQAVVEVEHLLSAEISWALGTVTRPHAIAHTLLACTDEEQHSLPLEALSAALAERNVAARYLGARVPSSAMRTALRRTGPDTVVLWSQTSQTAHLAQLDDVANARPTPKLTLAAGPGWDAVDLPQPVQRPVTLAQAVSLITGA